MALFFYGLGIRIYWLGIVLASFFNSKARKFVDGRRAPLPSVLKGSGKTIWFHCASLGEFEQARPLIEKVKRVDGNKVVVTFFSPSGYEVRKNYQLADHVLYLPIDTPSKVQRFLDAVKPDLALFIKYELWFNYIHECGKRRIPLFMVSGLFRPDHFLFRFPGSFLLPELKAFTHFFLQDQRSVDLLKAKGFLNASMCGDSRYDRVYDIMQEASDMPVVKAFCGNSFTVVAGSTWPVDEEILKEIFSSEEILHEHIKLVIAPHNISKEGVIRTLNLFPDAVLFSSLTEGKATDSRVLIIDNVGMLSSLYRYASFAYVGGGFGKAVHNVLEPLVYGIPVCFGPENKKFHEIAKIKANQCGKEIINSGELKNEILSYYRKPELLTIQKERANKFIDSERGAVKLILKEIGFAERVYAD